MKPASANWLTALTTASTESPQGMASAISSGRTGLDAASKAAVLGSSELTFHPPPNQPNSSNASLDGGVAIGVVTDRQLSDSGLALAAGGVEGGDDGRHRLDGNQAVSFLSGQPTGLLA